jgi:WD40 repeat protein
MAVHEAEFDPHSNYLAAVSTPGEIWIWDLANAKCVGAAMQHDEFVYRVRWDPSGRQLATACADNYARIFDWNSGMMVCQSMPQRNDVYDACFSQDGRWLYTIGENGLIVMWSTRDGGFVDQYPVAPSTGQALFWQRAGQLDGDPSGRYLLTSGWRRAVERLDIGRNDVDLYTDVIRMIRASELTSSLRIEHGGAVPITTSEWIKLWREHVASGSRRP